VYYKKDVSKKETQKVIIVDGSVKVREKTSVITVKPLEAHSKDVSDFVSQTSIQFEKLEAAIEESRRLLEKTQALAKEMREIMLKGRLLRQKSQDSRNPKIVSLPEEPLKPEIPSHSAEKTNTDAA
jgi:hypothetical protein